MMSVQTKETQTDARLNEDLQCVCKKFEKTRKDGVILMYDIADEKLSIYGTKLGSSFLEANNWIKENFRMFCKVYNASCSTRVTESVNVNKIKPCCKKALGDQHQTKAPIANQCLMENLGLHHLNTNTNMSISDDGNDGNDNDDMEYNIVQECTTTGLSPPNQLLWKANKGSEYIVLEHSDVSGTQDGSVVFNADRLHQAKDAYIHKNEGAGTKLESSNADVSQAGDSENKKTSKKLCPRKRNRRKINEDDGVQQDHGKYAKICRSSSQDLPGKEGVGKVTNSRYQLIPHENTVMYKCLLCGIKVKHRRSIFKHLAKHDMNSEGNHTCDQCSMRFLTPHRLKLHMAWIHKKPIHGPHKSKQMVLKCHLCQSIFNSKVCMMTHVIERHQDVLSRCSKYANSLTAANKDKDKHHCPRCRKSFFKFEDLVFHVASHQPGGNYVCEVCGRSFHFLQSFEYHRSTHLRITIKPYSCEKCQRKHATKRALQLHQKSMHREKVEFICETCGKVFSMKSILNKHKRNHVSKVSDIQSDKPSDKQFVCEVCGYKVRSGDCFRGHVISKHFELAKKKGWKYFTCEYCDKKSWRHLQHVAHVRQHTGEKPYSCSMCSSRFAMKSYLIHHVQFTHEFQKKPTIKFPCKICNVSFYPYNKLLQHMTGDRHSDKCLQMGINPQKMLANLLREREKTLGRKDNGIQDDQSMQKELIPAKPESDTSPEEELYLDQQATYRYGDKWKAHTCQVCNASFHERSQLLRHMKSTKHRIKCSLMGRNPDKMLADFEKQIADSQNGKNTSKVGDSVHTNVNMADNLKSQSVQHDTEINQEKEMQYHQNQTVIEKYLKPKKKTCYPCPVCFTSYQTRPKLRRHLKTDKHRLNCQQVGKNPDMEVTDVIEMSMKESEPKTLVCEENYLNHSVELKEHSEIEIQPQNHQAVIVDESMVVQHRREIGQGQRILQKDDKDLNGKKAKYFCEACQMSFQKRSTVRQHLVTVKHRSRCLHVGKNPEQMLADFDKQNPPKPPNKRGCCTERKKKRKVSVEEILTMDTDVSQCPNKQPITEASDVAYQQSEHSQVLDMSSQSNAENNYAVLLLYDNVL